MNPLTMSMLRAACDEDATDGAIVLDAVLEPLGGHGTPVNPAIYAGGRYQHDKRWESADASEPTSVVVIDNVPSQANRLEAALEATADKIGAPRLVLDLTGEDFAHLPPHLPRSLSSLRWPHRNADAYLRDALLDGEAFVKSSVGRSIIDATADSSGALVAWFPQALLYGFWQSHLGSKRTQAKHARAWVSEIVGWGPGSDELVTTAAMKGDPYNIIKEVGLAEHNKDDLIAGWELQEGKSPTEEKKMSAIGHGQVITRPQDETLAPVSFRRITQRATLSFPQLRRVRLGDGYSEEQDAAARTLIGALGLHAHHSAFGRAIALRSGTDLVVIGSESRLDSTEVTINDTASLVKEALEVARAVGVPTEGWGTEPIQLTPNKGLTAAIRATWPDLGRAEE